MNMRSLLMMPANVTKFVQKAHLYGADAVMLDLEDAVSPNQKPQARAGAREAIQLISSNSCPVYVRVNNDSSLEADLQAVVCPALRGVVLPKAEDAGCVVRVSALLDDLEAKAGMAVGALSLILLVETPRGVLHMEELAGASSRTEAMMLGTEDLCREYGIDRPAMEKAFLFPLSHMILCCKAWRIAPLGLLGSVAEFQNLPAFRRSAEEAKLLGCEGGFCIHPKQVSVLNSVYSDTGENMDWARGVVSAYEEGIRRGAGAVSLHGTMIDRPIYLRAKRLLSQSEGGFPPDSP